MTYEEYLQTNPKDYEPILPWMKFFYQDYATLAKLAGKDEHNFSQLIHGFFHYMATAEILKLDSDLMQAVLELKCDEIGNKITAYRKKCKTNKENRNGTDGDFSSPVVTFQQDPSKANKDQRKAKIDFPPSALKSLFKHLSDGDLVDIDEYTFGNFCADLKKEGWKFNGAQITDIRQLESIVKICYPAEGEYWFDTVEEHSKIFGYFIAACSKKWVDGSDHDLDFFINEAWEENFMGQFEIQGQYWTVAGKTYAVSSYRDAIRAELLTYDENDDS